MNCPAHQDTHASCSINIASGLWHCLANCGAKGNIIDLFMAARSCDFITALAELESRAGIAPPAYKNPPPARRLPAPKKDNTPKKQRDKTTTKRGQVVAVFRFFDAEGRPAYQKKRIEPGRDGRKKEFAFEHFTSTGTAPGRGDNPALLYGLPLLATAPPGEVVFVVEGEGKADALTAWGFIAVCTDSGAAGRWPEGFNQYFTGRRVVLLPDNDPPGEKYAGTVAAALQPLADSIEVLRLPGLPEKGDVVDWIAARRDAGLSDDEIKAELFDLAANACEPWKAPPAAQTALVIPPGDDDEADENTPTRGRRNRGAPRLLAMIENEPLLCDASGGTFFQIDGEVMPLDPKNPRTAETLAARYYAATGEALAREGMAFACQILSHRARQTGEVAPMANRVAAVGDALLVDLGNNRAAKITAEGWEVVTPLPGTFREWLHKRPQVTPTRPGNLRRLLDFVSVASEDAELFLFSLVAALAPGQARPALALEGPQGSGKTSGARKIKRVHDPSTPEVSLIPRKIEDLDLILARNAVVVLDNLTFLTPELADYFCGLITGAGLLRRVLHTTSELLEINVDALLIFTGISSLTSRPDLTERILKIRLERINDADRKTDGELDREFSEALPEILGGLFDCLAGGLALLEKGYRPERLPRLAEFARLAAACAEACEPGAGARYLAAFTSNQGNQYAELSETDSFFAAVVEICRSGERLSGSFKDVCARIREVADPGPKDKFPSARSLRKTVERLRVPLDHAGIICEMSKPGDRCATAKATVAFFTCDTAAAAPADPWPMPEEPPELAGLVFDDSEIGL